SWRTCWRRAIAMGTRRRCWMRRRRRSRAFSARPTHARAGRLPRARRSAGVSRRPANRRSPTYAVAGRRIRAGRRGVSLAFALGVFFLGVLDRLGAGLGEHLLLLGLARAVFPACEHHLAEPFQAFAFVATDFVRAFVELLNVGVALCHADGIGLATCT